MSLISFYQKGIRQTKPTRNVEPEEIIKLIRSGEYKKLITKYRSTENPIIRTQLKEALPYVTWHGTFKNREDNSIIQHSGLACMDFDHIYKGTPEEMLKQSVRFKTEINNLPFVFASFTSPTGDGEKVIIKINPEKHKKSFLALEKFFIKKIPGGLDKKAKALSQACFMSDDPLAFINTNSATFNPAEETELPSEVLRTGDDLTVTAIADQYRWEDYLKDFKKIAAWTDKQETYEGKEDGAGDNNYAFLFACQANRYGIPEYVMEQYALSNFTSVPENKLRATISSAYKHGREAEHGKLRNRKRNQGDQSGTVVQQTPGKPPERTNPPDAPDGETVLFDDKTKRIVQGLFWLQVVNKKTKEEIITIESDLLLEFLQEQGFFQQIIETQGQPDTLQMLRIVENKIAPVHRQIIKQFIREWSVKENVPRKVKKKFISGSKNLFSSETFDFLHAKKVTFQRDTQEEAFLYFPHNFIRITKNGIDTHPYSDLSAPIWKHQIIKHPYTHHTDYSESEYFRFIKLAITGKEEISKEDVEPGKNILSICSGLGYLMHSFRNPSQSFSINLFDRIMARRHDANGRTGKSLMLKMLNYVKPVAIIDCRATEINALRRPETYGEVNFHTAVILFDDVPKNFSYDIIFPFVTSDIKVKRLYTDPMVIPFSMAPKPAMAANYILEGEGTSYSGRQKNFDVTDFFKPNYTPADHFGHNLANDWNEREWNMFYSFIIHCIQLHLQKGFLPFSGEYDLNKLKNKMHDAYYKFFEALVLNHKYEKQHLINSLKEEYDFEPKTPNQFTAALRAWADYRNYIINPHIIPKTETQFPREKSGTIDYITIARGNPEVVQGTIPV